MEIQINVAEFKDRLSKYLDALEKGTEIVLCRRNLPIARLKAVSVQRNRSKPGWAKGSVTILGDIEAPAIPEKDWNMLGNEGEYTFIAQTK